MKFELIIDPESEEKVVVNAKKEGALTEEIKRLLLLYGFNGFF